MSCSCSSSDVYVGSQCQWHVTPGIEFLGANVTTSAAAPPPASAADCAEACTAAAPACKAWVWFNETTTCVLKRTAAGGTKTNVRAVSGLPTIRVVCTPSCLYGTCQTMNGGDPGTFPSSCNCDSGWVDDGLGPDDLRCSVPVCNPGCKNNGTCVAPDTCDCRRSGFTGAVCDEGGPAVLALPHECKPPRAGRARA
jgi:hypothetical protein